VKSISTSLRTHLRGEVTTLATCWELTRRDGFKLFFTDHDVDLVIDGDTYIASTGYKRTAIQNDATLAVDNLDVEGIFDSSAITEQDLRAGVYDYAEVRIFLVNWADLSQGILRLRRGWLGEVLLTPDGIFKAELRGLTQLLSQNIGNFYTPECRVDLGDLRCKVPIQPPLIERSTNYPAGQFVRVFTDTGADGQAQFENRIYECTTAGTTAGSAPTFNTTVGATTTDGSAVFTAREAWMRHGVVDTVASRQQFTLTSGFSEPRAVDGWFVGGALVFESGDNAGKSIEIRGWVLSTRQVTLFLPPGYPVQAGVRVRLYPGCDKQPTTCAQKFAIPGSVLFPVGRGNIWNYQGEPHIPGTDSITSYPDAASG